MLPTLKLAAAVVLLLLCAPAVAGAQTVTLSGRVLERQVGTPIAGARLAVENGAGSTATDAEGSFRIGRLRAGVVTVRIDALGFASRRIELELDGDVTLDIELDVQPLDLGTVEAMRPITIRGRVTGSDTRLGLPARIYVRPGGDTRASGTGRYQVRNLAAGDTVVVHVEAFGYSPEHVMVISDTDVQQDFALEVDIVAETMIARQLERLRQRTVGIHRFPVRRIDREGMLANGTAVDVLRFQMGVHQSRCVLIDERWRPHGLDELELFPAHTIHSMEVYDRGAMVRVYTTEFIRMMVAGRVTLQPITFDRSLIVNVCR